MCERAKCVNIARTKYVPERRKCFNTCLLYSTLLYLLLLSFFLSLLLSELALKAGQSMQHRRPRDDLTQTAK